MSIATIAGCTSDGGGSNQGGQSGGSNGSGGSEGSGNSNGSGKKTGSGSSKDLQTVRFAMGPGGFAGIVNQYISKRTNILEKNMQEAGATAKVQKTWGGSTQFAAGGPDFANFGSIEAALIGANRELKLSILAKVQPNYPGFAVRPGSDYDPEVAGGVVEAIQAMADQNALVGVGGWNGGDIPGYALSCSTADRQFKEEGEFKVTTADYNALGELLAKGDLDVAGTHPITNAADLYMNDEIKQVFWNCEYLAENGFGTPNQNTWVTNTEYAENNPDITRALVHSWREGVTWFHDNIMSEVKKEDHWDNAGASTKEGAVWSAEWGFQMNGGHGMGKPVLYKDIELTDSYIKDDKEVINKSADLGFVPENWTDFVEYRKVSQE